MSPKYRLLATLALLGLAVLARSLYLSQIPKEKSSVMIYVCEVFPRVRN